MKPNAWINLKLEFFSIQSTFFIPIAKDQQGVENGEPWLSHDGYQWWTQLYYDQKISSKFRAFLLHVCNDLRKSTRF